MSVAHLDPDALQLFKLSQAAPRKPPDEVPLAEARAGFRAGRLALSPDPPEVAVVRDAVAPGDGVQIPVRIYRALGTRSDEPLPAVIYAHGGGWVFGDLDTHDVTCRQLANAARCCVIAVHYRLAPESRFPAAVDDGYAVLVWAAANAASLSIDGARLAVCGDSSGGNVAAVSALMARAAGGPHLRAQILIYPVVDVSQTQDSYRHAAEGFTLTSASMRWFRTQYVPDERDWADWRVSPLRAPDLRGLPRTYLVTAGNDPLRDEGRAYAMRLEADGVAVDYRHFAGQMHGFVGSGRIIRAAAAVMADAALVLAG